MNWERQWIIEPNGLIRWDEAMRVTDDEMLAQMRGNKLVHDLVCNCAFMGVRTGCA